MLRLLRLAPLAAVLAGPIRAAAEPAFVFATPPERDGVAWSSSAQAGFTLSGGNTRSLGLTSQAKLARTDRWNRLSLEGEAAFARSRVEVADEQDGAPGIGPGELRGIMLTTRQAWMMRARYDRFLARRTGAFVAARLDADRPAGRRLVTGAQLGYGVSVAATSAHEVRLETGYDFAREQPISLNYKLNGKVQVGLRTTATYASVPSVRPAPAGTSFSPGYAPIASRWDATTDVVLTLSIL